MAIAFNAAVRANGGATSGSSYTVTVPTSAGTIIFVGFSTVTAATILTCTLNGVSMTPLSTIIAVGQILSPFYMLNPPSGNQTIAFTFATNSSWESVAGTYTDSAAVGTGIDNSNTFTTATSTASETLTPSLSGNWMATFVGGAGADAIALSNCTRRSVTNSAQRNLNLFDNDANALTSSSPFTMTQTVSSGGCNMFSTIFNIPNGTSPTSTLPYRSLLGVGI